MYPHSLSFTEGLAGTLDNNCSHPGNYNSQHALLSWLDEGSCLEVYLKER